MWIQVPRCFQALINEIQSPSREHKLVGHEAVGRRTLAHQDGGLLAVAHHDEGGGLFWLDESDIRLTVFTGTSRSGSVLVRHAVASGDRYSTSCYSLCAFRSCPDA